MEALRVPCRRGEGKVRNFVLYVIMIILTVLGRSGLVMEFIRP